MKMPKQASAERLEIVKSWITQPQTTTQTPAEDGAVEAAVEINAESYLGYLEIPRLSLALTVYAVEERDYDLVRYTCTIGGDKGVAVFCNGTENQ